MVIDSIIIKQNVQSPLILAIRISVLRHNKLTIFWTFHKIRIIGHIFKEKWHVNSYIRISLQLEYKDW
jgi:hypothetical protein